jgi:predicted RNase H-like HicB family nuclease
MELTANICREEGSYWAEVSELPGCFASGDNLEELLDSLLEGVRLYLGDAEAAMA